ncbi:MAG: hypothetical protein WCC12_24035, partial [Anaerolineales bacterium]
MKCPNCEHVSDDKVLLRCAKCGEVFERGVIEELTHLAYLQNWLEKHKQQIGEAAFDFITVTARRRADELLVQIAPPKEEIPASPPTPVAAPLPVRASAPAASTVPVAATKVQPVVSVPAIPNPPAPPRPPRPPIDWKKVRGQIGDAATSGALLRALLYLSAFMIVVSATVLVIRFWDSFSPVVQLLFMAAVPVTFYAGGWGLRSRLKLLQAGTVLTGIGAVLAAVDFYAFYQFGGLAGRVNGPVYWLIVAIFCTALYAFTAWRLQGEFFDYLTLLGGASIFVAITRVLHTPLEWTVVSVTLAAAIMTVLAGRFKDGDGAWKDFGTAARYLSQILIPASVFYAIFSPARPPLGPTAAFLLAALGYVVLAEYFPSIRFAYAALVASIGTVIFGARIFELALEWYPTLGSVLALIYLLIGRRVEHSESESSLMHHYAEALNRTSLALIALALLGGYGAAFYGKTWPAVAALTLASLDLAVCAYLFRKAGYTALASGLFVIPFTLGWARWFQDGNVAQSLGWMTAAWNGLALLYIGIGAILYKTEKHADWLYLWGHIITIIALLVLPLDYFSKPEGWHNIPALVSLGLAFSVHLLSFVLQDSGRHPSFARVSNWLPYGLGKSIFLWLQGLLLPVWIAVAWYGSSQPRAWLGATLAGLGLAYLAAGQWLFKRAREYRLPLHVYVYGLCILGISQALFTYYPLLTALLLAVAAAIALAYIYDRLIETTIASLLFIWPCALSLDLFQVPEEAHSLVYALLGSLIYIPVAIQLNRFQNARERFHPIPVFLVGYLLSLYA